MTDFLFWHGQKSALFVAFPSPYGGGYVAGFIPGPGETPDWRNTKVALWRSEAADPDAAKAAFYNGELYATTLFRVRLAAEPSPAEMIDTVYNYLRFHKGDDK